VNGPLELTQYNRPVVIRSRVGRWTKNGRSSVNNSPGLKCFCGQAKICQKFMTGTTPVRSQSGKRPVDHCTCVCVCVCVCVCDFCDRCDAGFESSETCTLPNNRHLPSTLVAAISSDEDLLSSFASVQGADVDYGCGVVSSGKAAVFNGPEQRLVETISLNTSASRLYGRLA